MYNSHKQTQPHQDEAVETAKIKYVGIKYCTIQAKKLIIYEHWITIPKDRLDYGTSVAFHLYIRAMFPFQLKKSNIAT